MKASLSCTAASIGALALGAIRVFLTGYVVSKLWAWFCVPYFGFPPISIAHALGIICLIRLALSEGTKNEDGQSKDEDRIDLWVRAIAHTINPLGTLLLGWILLQFM